MTKEMMVSMAQKYDMTLNRNAVTAQAVSYTKDSDNLIPELDKYADDMNNGGATVVRTHADKYTYSIYIPTGWVKLGEV